MNQNIHENIRKQLIEMIGHINVFWLEGRLYKITDCFDEKINLSFLDLRNTCCNRQDCFELMNKFIQTNRIIRFDEDNFVFDIIPGKVKAKCNFHMEFITDNVRQKKEGKDIFIFRKERGKWIVEKRFFFFCWLLFFFKRVFYFLFFDLNHSF